MGHHPTVAFDTPAGRVDIDEQLATLIPALWRRGVTTRQCCQHDELSDSAEISFPTAADAAAFVAAVFPAGDDEQDQLQARIRDWQVYDPAPSTARDGWRWTAVPEWSGASWDFAVLVQFPTADITEVASRVSDRT